MAMIECECIARKIGNSIGVTFPKTAVEEGKIKPNTKVKILILEEEQDPFDATVGMLKGMKFNTDEVLREADKGWE